MKAYFKIVYTRMRNCLAVLYMPKGSVDEDLQMYIPAPNSIVVCNPKLVPASGLFDAMFTFYDTASDFAGLDDGANMYTGFEDKNLFSNECGDSQLFWAENYQQLVANIGAYLPDPKFWNNTTKKTFSNRLSLITKYCFNEKPDHKQICQPWSGIYQAMGLSPYGSVGEVETSRP